MADIPETVPYLGIKTQPNQIHRELEGLIGLNPFRAHNSASRVQMFGSHIGQCLSIIGGGVKFLQSGMEREYGKYTFNIKMPVDAEVVEVIDRYRPQVGVDTIKLNPQRVVVYEDFHTHEIGMVSIPDFCSQHSYFGFRYNKKPIVNQLQQRMNIPAGTILADSPAITPTGDYKYGIPLNVAYLSLPGTAEDGAIIADDVLERLRFRTYERRTEEWGSKFFPINLYGDENHYKPFPDIGDYVREDGLLFCLREYDPELALVEQSVLDCREVDYTFDRRKYAVAGTRGRVVDVKVHHDARNTHGRTPLGMEAQTMKYDMARRQFYQEILNTYYRLLKVRGKQLRLTPQFHNLVKEALSVVGETKEHIHLLFKRSPMDDWRVEITVEYEITPREGFKITDENGGKSVLCKVVPRSHMPVDENGVSADIVTDPGGTVSRNNPGRLFEQYYNSASRDVVRRIRNDLGLPLDNKKSRQVVEGFLKTEPTRIQKAIEYLLGYYKILTPWQYADMVSGVYDAPLHEHLIYVLDNWDEKGIHLFIPPENPPEPEQIVQEIEAAYPPTFGPVSYIGNSGERVTTKQPVRIGCVYMLLLEKIADDWTAVSSGKLQHFGVLSQVTNWDKNSQPSHNQAIRAFGESEIRIVVAAMGPLATAEILDRNNNPLTHKAILHAIFHAEKPTNIPLAVDRDKIPLGADRPRQLIKHLLEVSGLRFVYRRQGLDDYEPARQSLLQKMFGAVKAGIASVINMFKKEK